VTIFILFICAHGTGNCLYFADFNSLGACESVAAIVDHGYCVEARRQ
jgi:hypothetical protein